MRWPAGSAGVSGRHWRHGRGWVPAPRGAGRRVHGSPHGASAQWARLCSVPGSPGPPSDHGSGTSSPLFDSGLHLSGDPSHTVSTPSPHPQGQQLPILWTEVKATSALASKGAPVRANPEQRVTKPFAGVHSTWMRGLSRAPRAGAGGRQGCFLVSEGSGRPPDLLAGRPQVAATPT